MWRGHLLTSGDQVPLPALVRATDGFTPADIAHAARTVHQRMFEVSVDTGTRSYAQAEDYLVAIAELRPTLTPEMVAAFEEDIATTART